MVAGELSCQALFTVYIVVFKMANNQLLVAKLLAAK